MANSSSPDYKALFLRAEEERRHEAELRGQAEESQRQAEESQRQAEKERDQGHEQTRQSTFGELIRHCHNLFSRPLRTEDPSRSTTGQIPAPTGKCCPLQLLPWTDCVIRQQEIYRSVCNYLEPSGQDAKQLFIPRLVLEGFGQELRRPISSEQDLVIYEHFSVENLVRDIIAALCKIPAARDEFQLSDGVSFDNHANALNPPATDLSQLKQLSTSRPSRPDLFCIRRVGDNSESILITVEYKPPHKLSVENLRSGLRPMRFWEEVVAPDSIPTQEPEKLRYNAARLTGSALVQEFYVMIQKGLEYSYITNGLAVVLLRVPYDNPTTLYYHLCEPNKEVNPEDDQSFQQPATSIARVLCLCLMSFRSRLRDQKWRNNARDQLPEWTTSFDHEHSRIPEAELRQNPPDAQYTPSVHTSPDRTGSEFLPSSPAESPTEGRRPPTRSQTQCAPSKPSLRNDSSDSDEEPTLRGQKRRFSQITSSPSSPSVRRSARQTGSGYVPSDQNQHHKAQFCTQRCLLGLQQGGLLDEYCPNVTLHRKVGSSSRHLINAETLIQQIKQQLDNDIDDCAPMGGCGASGAPFKITCAIYGYTVVGKGTTSYLWNEVSREADIYRILSRIQGSVVPVFLGAIDLAKIYFLHGAGEIRHMLLMAWAGKPISKTEATSPDISSSISKSIKEIRSLGVLHQDLRLENFLWNDELRRVLIIDFHCSVLDRQLINKRMRLPGKIPSGADTRKQTRLRPV
ncbi:hypothetical protein BO70DRAFT_366579 [Aspergillus heteromorphus CBS 117.55]|uniref:Protein kinase domain-containing protein n=1 Tax=Aspergillus heteromorphus CBS 117.55 TaxID=1448321 RepID=A0A317UVK2_9EURO|nr:uncharacterized protein BO70DRAFT_366579 [Aspergillus heteromorphus CBS 117.55]PWY66093.1 hypothetical protein BO70DRAFT_366579 [Aspergillus heteromorphus CBS 117.55]